MTDYTVDHGSGRVAGALQLPSPNHDPRPVGSDVELVVLHGISLPPGHFGGDWVEALFTNRLDPAAHPFFQEIRHLRVSTHLYIRRCGTLVQFVPLHRRAWHAGRSRFEGRTECNDFSVGIELEGTDEIPYTEAQYETLLPVLRALLAAYPALGTRRVVGHCDVAPERKTDPGPAFDWERVRAALHHRGV